MHSMLGHSCVAVALMAASLACAQDADLEEGKKLYEKECMVCHGFNNSGKTGENRWPRYRLARAQAAHVGATLVDAGETDVHLAVAPPFGPNLGGVYGRPAGAWAWAARTRKCGMPARPAPKRPSAPDFMNARRVQECMLSPLEFG